MSVQIAGMGWVTPLGSGVEEVWSRLLRSEKPQGEAIKSEEGGRSYKVFKVPSSALAGLPLHPRLRRSSAISRYSAFAGLAAIEDAKKNGVDLEAARLGIIFAISNGGVIYTRRFYGDIAKSGANSASPILFPETVFNAPASHLAALLGLSGQTYSLVDDGSVGLSAVDMAVTLLEAGTLDACLVVGAEEADWLLCDAYARWRLVPKEHEIPGRDGMVLSEGAGAILLTPDGAGPVRIEQTQPSAHYAGRNDLEECLTTVISGLKNSTSSIAIGSSNRTFIDKAESGALSAALPEAMTYMPKHTLGESVGASSIWQTIIGAKALVTQTLPGAPCIDTSTNDVRKVDATDAIIISCGLNQGISALRLSV